MVGKAPEIVCRVNEVEILSLVDTGSQISSLAFSKFQSDFSDLTLHDLSTLLKIESVAGDSLPYHGYIECTITIPVTDSICISDTIPVLIVPDTKYNSQVPLLLGTNILCKLLAMSVIPSFLPLKLAAQALTLEARHLDRSQGVYGHVFATQDMSIPPFSGKVGEGRTTIIIPVCQQIAMVTQHIDSVPVVPALVNMKQGINFVPVEIFNDSDSEIHISKGEQIASIHQASVELQNSLENSKFLDSFDLTHLSEPDALEVKKFLLSNRDVFAMSVQEMGCTDLLEHHIEMDDPTPFKEKCRPIPPGMYAELKDHLAELLSAGVIKESKSPFSSNIVLVRKQDGSLRVCTDMRRINIHTIRDSYSIPRIDTLIDSLRGARYFASLDLISGYHQIRVFRDHTERTAFQTLCGFYEHVKMPFGLKNAPATFQRMIEKVLDGLIMKTCAVYLDDVVVHGKTKEELYNNLAEIFDRFRVSNLRLKPKKCKFFRTSIEFLGHTVTSEGVKCSDKHIEDVMKWPEPENVKNLQTFLGFANFYRRFVPGFAHISDPLTKLLRGHCHRKSRTKSARSNTKHVKSVSEPAPWEWGKEQKAAFAKIKSSLCSPPCLAYPDFEKPFQLHCDASRVGLGAALYQADESGKLHPVAYASRTLNATERNYSAYKLEFLALKWSITVKFAYYLTGNAEFKVFTDHNPLVYLTTSARLDALGHRWLAELSSFHFSIHYKPGILNRDADGLSRRPDPDKQGGECIQVISSEVFQELCKLVTSSDFYGVAEVSGVSPTALSNAITIEQDYAINWAEEQLKDADVSRVAYLVGKGTKLSERLRQRESPGVMRLLSQWKRLIVKDGILYLQSQIHTGEKILRLVIPKHMQEVVLTLSHDDLGHLGRDKTLSVASERYYWVGLTKSVENKIKSCRRCICAKTPYRPDRAPLESIVTTRPLQLVCMDFLGLEESKGKFCYILVITDHYTKYSIAVPTKNQEAKTVAKILIDQFIVHYGIPERLHSDQGGSFEGKVIKHFCKLLGIEKSRTTCYHPEGNGIVERMNRTLISMLKTLEVEKKGNWKEHVAPLVHAYNCCRHSSTGFTPFYLMFGRSPRLPIDVFLGIPEPEGANATASNIRQNLQAAYQAANEAAKQARFRQSEGYNKKVRGAKIEVGDYVLVKNVGLKGKQKLADKWKSELHIVVKQPNTDIPVYVVRPEDGSREKVLHRNMLLPLVLPWPEDSTVDNVDNDFNVDSEVSSNVDSEDSLSIEVQMLEQASPEPQVIVESRESDFCDNVEVDDNASIVDVSVGESTHLSTPQPVADDLDRVPAVDYSIQPVQSLSPSRTVHGDIPSLQSPSVRSPEDSRIPVSPQLRRSARVRNPPVKLGDYVCCAGTVNILDWQVKVAALLQLLPLFPLHHADVCHAIIYVISHAQF